MPWDFERLTPREFDVLLAGAQWREEREWERVRVLNAGTAAAAGAKADLGDVGESHVPGYRPGEA